MSRRSSSSSDKYVLPSTKYDAFSSSVSGTSTMNSPSDSDPSIIRGPLWSGRRVGFSISLERVRMSV